MKRSAPAKAERVLRFLLALQDEDIASTLVAHGMRDADFEAGWRALRAMTPRSIERARRRPDTAQQREATRELERWTALWSAIIRAALEEAHPRAYAMIAGEHAAIVSSAVIAADRILRALDEVEAPARALLRDRGLSDEVADRARALIELATELAPPDPDSEYGVDRQEAEQAMWRWYLRWSAVARAAIRNRTHLHRLGYGAMSSGDGAGA